jgi:hypothetical protein
LISLCTAIEPTSGMQPPTTDKPQATRDRRLASCSQLDPLSVLNPIHQACGIACTESIVNIDDRYARST